MKFFRGKIENFKCNISVGHTTRREDNVRMVHWFTLVAPVTSVMKPMGQAVHAAAALSGL